MNTNAFHLLLCLYFASLGRQQVRSIPRARVSEQEKKRKKKAGT